MVPLVSWLARQKWSGLVWEKVLVLGGRLIGCRTLFWFGKRFGVGQSAKADILIKCL